MVKIDAKKRKSLRNMGEIVAKNGTIVAKNGKVVGTDILTRNMYTLLVRSQSAQLEGGTNDPLG